MADKNSVDIAKGLIEGTAEALREQAAALQKASADIGTLGEGINDEQLSEWTRVMLTSTVGAIELIKGTIMRGMMDDMADEFHTNRAIAMLKARKGATPK